MLFRSIPTVDDILHMRTKTTGIIENKFQYTDDDGTTHDGMLIDVGGQRGERRKWIHCFDNLDVMIYCASLIDYDLKLTENKDRNRLEESITVFAGLMDSPWIDTIGTKILFLNKTDLFREKIIKYPLSEHLPNDYRSRLDIPKENTYEASSEFIKKLYLEKIPSPICGSRGIEIFCHFTCAIDRENIKYIHSVVFQEIFMKNLEAIGI